MKGKDEGQRKCNVKELINQFKTMILTVVAQVPVAGPVPPPSIVVSPEAMASSAN